MSEQIQGKQESEVEVSLNGKEGPTVKFRIGVIAIIQVMATLLAFGAASAMMRADVDRLKIEVGHNTVVNDEILKEVIELKTSLGYVRDEIRYYRERMDRIQMKGEKQQ